MRRTLATPASDFCDGYLATSRKSYDARSVNRYELNAAVNTFANLRFKSSASMHARSPATITLSGRCTARSYVKLVNADPYDYMRAAAHAAIKGEPLPMPSDFSK